MIPKKSYTLYTEAIFNKVPNDLKGYNVKTTYYDANDSEIGHETETLDNIYMTVNIHSALDITLHTKSLIRTM